MNYKKQESGMTKSTCYLIIFLSVAGCSASSGLSERENKINEQLSKSFTVDLKTIDTRILQNDKTIEEINFKWDEERQKLIEKKFREVLNFCSLVLNDYESESLKQSRLALYANLSGLIAGSVIAPALIAANAAANATTSAIFAGWAGVTNLAGKSIEEYGLSGTSSATTRNNIVNNITKEIEIITNGDNDFYMRRDALLRMRSACVAYVVTSYAHNSE